MSGKTRRLVLFRGYERFWHWSQAVLMIGMALTGFEIRGTYTLFGFETAIDLHVYSAWALIVLWVFTIFWHLTTGEFRHYLPRTEGVVKQIEYYVRGIFLGDPAPFHPSEKAKHNPLQRLAYLALKAFMIPLIWVTGLLYLFYNDWVTTWLVDLGLTLEIVAILHVIAAFLMLLFLIAHLYLITTGETIGQHMKAMITGWEDVPVDDHHDTPKAGSSEKS
ncbi:cytochrome b/b6 domain-containing protein [Reinekea blandensis]|uniref:cytochrome b/b6 domain-containing protein n=1 Tax=Reinekea blandensis TaxID=374838 RepID=UPI00031626F9|nr:cytochrome b/b6 domain-containing protein [Reinekea blandensis]